MLLKSAYPVVQLSVYSYCYYQKQQEPFEMVGCFTWISQCLLFPEQAPVAANIHLKTLVAT